MFAFPKLNQFEFHHVLEEARGTALVIFSSHTCSACRAWEQLLDKLQQQDAGLQVLEVDAQQEMALTQEFEVFHLPALFLFRDGEYYGELQCEAEIDAVRRTVRYMLAQPAQEMP